MGRAKPLSLVGSAVLLLAALSAPAAADLIENFNAPGPAGNYTGANFVFPPGHPNIQTPPFETGPDANSDGEFLRLKEFPASGFYRSFNAVGFDRTNPGQFGRIVLNFDFRITCGGTRVVGSGFDFRCADGFSVGVMNTATFGTSGIPFTLNENGHTAVSTTEPARHKSFALGFNTFDNGEGSNNSLNLNWNGSRVGPTIHLGSTFDIVTGSNRIREEFQHAEIDLVLGALPTVTVRLTDGSGNTITPYNGFDLSGIIVDGLAVGPYDSRIGFFTRTGDSTESVDLDNIHVQYLDPIGVVSAPEPGALALLAFGTAALAGLRRRRR